MTPFAIAGIRMRIDAAASNVAAMRARLDRLMARFRPSTRRSMGTRSTAFARTPAATASG